MYFDAILVGMSLAAVLFLAALAAIAVLVELHFIRKRKKGEWIFPVVVTALAIAMIIPNAKMTSTQGGGRGSYCIGDNDHPAEVSMVLDADHKMAAVGYLMVGEGENAQYLPLEFKEGKLIGKEEAMEYKQEIEGAMKSLLKGFTGKSLPADQLEEAADKAQVIEKHFSWTALFMMCILYAPAPILLWAVYLISRIRRHRRNRLEKLKLQDLS